MKSIQGWAGLAGVLAVTLASACGSSSGNASNPADSGTSSDATGMVCTPGQSIACVGAAGCQGGQACKSDGSGYEACVCASDNDGGGMEAGVLDSSRGSDGSSATDGSGGQDAAESGAGCTSYMSSTVAAMRQGTPGCYSLADVVSIGTTPGTASPTLYFQDAAGGDYSAMRTTCSSSSAAHPCSQAAAVAAITNGHSITLTGSYVRNAVTHAEAFYLASITDNGMTVTVPPVAAGTLAQIQRASTAYNLAFQVVSVSVQGGQPLLMWDWSPSDFAVAGAACPYQLGFGMAFQTSPNIPACTNGTSQPAGRMSPSPQETLIGTDFYSGFTISTDCRCAKSSGDQEPSSTSQLSGTARGVLVWTVPEGSSSGFMYLAPQSNADLPITNTVAGM